MIYISVLVFIFGLLIGSFLNVLVYRINDLKSIWLGRSFCPHCKHKLAWYDLFPLFSYLALGGKCRYCQKEISVQYPLVELFTAILWTTLFMYFGMSLNFIFYSVIYSILLVVFVYDLQKKLIPMQFLGVAAAMLLLGNWYFSGYGFWTVVWGGLIAGLILSFFVYGSYIFIKKTEVWMGSGDIWLGATLGLLVANISYSVLMLFLAFLFGSIVGLIYIKLRKKSSKEALPFAPFLIFASFVTLLFGNVIISWYTGNFYMGAL